VRIGLFITMSTMKSTARKSSRCHAAMSSTPYAATFLLFMPTALHGGGWVGGLVMIVVAGYMNVV
jgi:hypothetical protein